MSRSNPNEHVTHPCTRWHEWHGQEGFVYYYDKDKKVNVEVGDKFKFILLDQLGVIKGWHDASDSGIQSNEVRDTKTQRFIVKAFKSGVLAQGFYADIRDRVKAIGGHYTSNLYIAYKSEAGMVLGSIQFKGAALNAWVEFTKQHSQEIWKKAVSINGSVEGKKGKITFKVPKFFISETTEQSETEAKTIDQFLQVYLKNYFQRTGTSQAAVAAEAQPPSSDEPPLHEPEPEGEQTPDDVPF